MLPTSTWCSCSPATSAPESDGKRPIGATLYYNRLGQRVIAALSAPTASGALFEVDTRLRPSGTQGPPAASLDSFARYQREQAWTWEHMALARARPIYGSARARGELAAIITSVLSASRDTDTLRADVLEMRATMAAHKPPRGALDIKLARGGLVDCEFLIHFLQLQNGIGLDPDLGLAITALVDAKLVAPELGEAQTALTRFLVAARLLAPDAKVPPPAAREALARACACGDWEEVIAGLSRARHHRRGGVASRVRRGTGDRSMSSHPAIGAPFPDATLELPDGGTVQPSAYRRQAAGGVLLPQG